nr:DMT family transporter [uncultured Cohaesibacter sp.]
MKAYLALAAAMILTGINVAIGKVIVVEMPPTSFSMLRFVLASLCLVPLAVFEPGGLASLARLSRRQWGEIVLLSLFGVVGFTTLMLIGLQYTTAINAGIIASSLPAIIALLSLLVLKEFISRRKVLSIALAVLGIACINLARPDDGSGSSDWLGTLLGNSFVLMAAFSEAVFAILTRRYSSIIPPWTLTMIVHLVAIPVTLPILLWLDGGWQLPLDAPLSFWLLAIYYIFASSILSFFLWCIGIKSVTASSSAIFTALVPTTTMFVAVLALGESMVTLQVMGLVAVFASLGIGLIARPQGH